MSRDQIFIVIIIICGLWMNHVIHCSNNIFDRNMENYFEHNLILMWQNVLGIAVGDELLTPFKIILSSTTCTNFRQKFRI